MAVGGQRDGSIGGVGMLAARVAADAPIVTTGFDGDGLKQHSWLAGITAPVGNAGNLMFSYAGNGDKNEEVADNFKVKSHNFGLGYRRNLSKRISVYGVATYCWSEDKGRHLANGAGKVKVTTTQAIVGLQHRF